LKLLTNNEIAIVVLRSHLCIWLWKLI